MRTRRARTHPTPWAACLAAWPLALACAADPPPGRCARPAECGAGETCAEGRCARELRPRITAFAAREAVVPHGSRVEVSWTLAGAAPDQVTLDGLSVGTRTSSTVRVRGRRVLGLVAANAAGEARAELELAGQGLSTFAGDTVGGVGANDGVGLEARMMGAVGIALARDGYAYFTDHGLNTVRRVAPDGEVLTFAGRAGAPGTEDGASEDARFRFPKGIALDRAGTLYVADNGSGTIRTITNGVVRTYAGAAGERVHVDGALADARFAQPDGLVFDAAGNLYVSESSGHCVRKIALDGTVTTFAGSALGASGFSDGVGAEARFLQPGALAIDGDDTLYVADTGNHAVRKVAPDGTVTTLAGGGAGYVDGDRSVARFHTPSGLAVDGVGNVYVADQANHAIRRVAPSGEVVTWAGASAPGWGDGRREGASFFGPYGLALDDAGRLWVGEVDNHTLRRIDPDGRVRTVAGKALRVGARDGPRLDARFLVPHSITTTAARGLPMYVADTANHVVRAIDPDGEVRTLAGAPGMPGAVDGEARRARFFEPSFLLVGPDGDLVVVDTGNSAVRRVARTGAVTTIAGKAGEPGSADGEAAEGRLRQPRGAAFDARGQLYLADTENGCVRRRATSGALSTLAGRCGERAHRDGLGASARFVAPASLAYDPAHDRLYVADGTTVRAIELASAAVATLAGQPERAGYRDGPADTAFFGVLSALAWDSAAGVLWAADTRALRRLSSDGEGLWRVETVAGTNAEWAAAEEGPLPGRLGESWGLAVVGEDLFVATPHGITRVTAAARALP